jgi:hypothetical protein
MYDPLTLAHESLVAGVQSEEDCAEFFSCVYGAYRRYHRPWYRHPRWHIHHWELQIHPWRTLRRWLFTRCCRCGQRFPWGAYVCTGSWDRQKPGWFQGEKGVYHTNCSNPYDTGVAASGS